HRLDPTICFLRDTCLHVLTHAAYFSVCRKRYLPDLGNPSLHRLVASVGFNEQLNIIGRGNEVALGDVLTDAIPAELLLVCPIIGAFNVNTAEVSIINKELDSKGEIPESSELTDHREPIVAGHKPRDVIRHVELTSVKVRLGAIPVINARCSKLFAQLR